MPLPPPPGHSYSVALALPVDSGLPGVFTITVLKELSVASSGAGSFSGGSPPVLGAEQEGSQAPNGYPLI